MQDEFFMNCVLRILVQIDDCSSQLQMKIHYHDSSMELNNGYDYLEADRLHFYCPLLHNFRLHCSNKNELVIEVSLL